MIVQKPNIVAHALTVTRGVVEELVGVPSIVASGCNKQDAFGVVTIYGVR
jgi:hypothetical protein